MKKLLIISLYYPPVQSIASKRLGSFVKYLDKRYFQIDVVTVKPKASQEQEKDINTTIYRVGKSPLDNSLVISDKTNYIIRKIKAIYNKVIKRFLLSNWKKKAKKKSFELYKIKQYDFVLSSYAPKETHEIALELKKYYPQIKWIADMRDEMSLNPFLSELKKLELKKLEQEIFTFCDALTTVSKPILDDFRNLAGNRSKEIMFGEIRNGFDFDINFNNHKNDIFTIRYLGSFYGDIKPTNFLNALKELVLEHKVQNICVEFIGKIGMVRIPRSLKKFVFVYPLVKQHEAVRLMKNSDVLLLIHPNNGRKGVYTGKLFEYLAVNKKILALIDTKDVAAELIMECNAGIVVENNDIKEIKNAIMTLYKEWKNNEKYTMNVELIKRHHRKEQAERLGKLMKEFG